MECRDCDDNLSAVGEIIWSHLFQFQSNTMRFCRITTRLSLKQTNCDANLAPIDEVCQPNQNMIFPVFVNDYRRALFRDFFAKPFKSFHLFGPNPATAGAIRVYLSLPLTIAAYMKRRIRVFRGSLSRPTAWTRPPEQQPPSFRNLEPF